MIHVMIRMDSASELVKMALRLGAGSVRLYVKQLIIRCRLDGVQDRSTSARNAAGSSFFGGENAAQSSGTSSISQMFRGIPILRRPDITPPSGGIFAPTPHAQGMPRGVALLSPLLSVIWKVRARVLLRALLREIPEPMAVDGQGRRFLNHGMRLPIIPSDNKRDGVGNARASPFRS